MLWIGIADDECEGTRFQRLLHGPQQCRRFFQRDGEEAVANKAQGFEAMTIEFAVFAFLAGEPAPEQWSAFRSQAAKRQGEGKAHGRWRIAIGLGGHIMKAGAG